MEPHPAGLVASPGQDTNIDIEPPERPSVATPSGTVALFNPDEMSIAGNLGRSLGEGSNGNGADSPEAETQHRQLSGDVSSSQAENSDDQFAASLQADESTCLLGSNPSPQAATANACTYCVMPCRHPLD